MPQSLVSLHVHIVFSTKNHAPFISSGIAPRLAEYIGGIMRSHDGQLLACGGTSDHIHLLVLLSKKDALSDTVRDVKSNSSRWVHETFPEKRDFAWQDGYGAFAVSFSQVPAVTGYINKQGEHHRKMTFREEFTAFLKRHCIEYDERYLWQ